MTDHHDESQVDQDEIRVGEILSVLHEDVRAPASLREGVMRRIEDQPPSVGARVATWLFSPRPVSVSPAVAGAVFAVLALLFLVRPTPAPVALPSEAGSAEPQRVVTRFVFVAPRAQSVHVTGDFTSWSRDGFALENLRGSGIWTGDIALPPGVHQYTFVIDGTEWIADPSAALQVDDGYGQTNSILIIPGEGEV